MTDQPRDDDFDALIAEGCQSAEQDLAAAARPQHAGDGGAQHLAALGLQHDDDPADDTAAAQSLSEAPTVVQPAVAADADTDAPVEAPATTPGIAGSGPAFEIDDETWAAAVRPYQPVSVPSAPPVEPPPTGWSLSSDNADVPTVQMDALELKAELAAVSWAPESKEPETAVASGSDAPAEGSAANPAVAPEAAVPPVATPQIAVPSAVVPPLPPKADPRGIDGLAALIAAQREETAAETEPAPASETEVVPEPAHEPAPEPEPLVEAAPEPAVEPVTDLEPEPAPTPDPAPTAASAPHTPPAIDDAVALAAIERVRGWVDRLEGDGTKRQRDKADERLAGLLQDPKGLEFAIAFVDTVIRPEDPKVSARNFEELSRDIPSFLDWYLKLGVTLGGGFGIVSPKLIIPVVKKAMREVVSHLVIDANPSKLAKPLAKLREDGTRLSLMPLGETALGNEGADARVQEAMDLLRRDDVDDVAVQVAAMAPQRQEWAFEETVDAVVTRLLPLYTLAAESPSTKRVTLGTEEFRDLDLALAVFERLLSRPELAKLEAGIVLQAALPETLGAYRRLAAFAKERRAQGGAGIAVRLVKGAHVASERVEATLQGWPLAAYSSKDETNANFTRVLREALDPENTFSVRLGIATHNLFDLAHAAEIARAAGTHQRIDAEVLLGMPAEHRDAVREVFPSLVLTVPVVQPDQFSAAVPYLIRRLEEHAATDGFLSALPELAEQPVFDRARDAFLAGLAQLRGEDEAAPGALPAPHRTQNRATEAEGAAHPLAADEAPAHEPTTDPSLAANRDWGRAILQRAATTELGRSSLEANRIDDWPTLEARIESAAQAAAGWAASGAEARAAVLRTAATTMGARRGQLIEIMVAETGLTLAGADEQVSAAIDATREHAGQATSLDGFEHATPKPVALTVVAPTWSAPATNPAAGVTAALATGSAVILKPAPQARHSAAVLCEALWEAGVPREVLVLCDLDEGPIVQQLVAHPSVSRVVLTGSIETAEQFSTWRSGRHLLAAASSKNTIVVTPSADFDAAVSDIVRSAFGRAGQRCGAATVAILVDTVGDSERFRRQLVDATRSLKVGSALDATTQVSALIDPASDDLLRALTTLEPEEEWLLEPQRLDDRGRIFSPGIRDAVEPGSFAHVTEFFGPHLTILEVNTLDEAIEDLNATEFGLAAGIHSLDPHEVAQWLAEARAGSLFVNRGTTGAIPGRQLFGGWKRSQVGPATASGGPNALIPLVDWEPVDRGPRESVRLHGLDKRVAELIEAATPAMDFLAFDRVRAGANSDQTAWEEEFGVARDLAGLEVERNVLRYRPADVLLRVAEDGTVADLVRLIAAAARTRAILRVSSAIEVPAGIATLGRQPIPHVRIEELVQESDAEFHARLADGSLLEPVENVDALGMSRMTEPLRRIRLVGTDARLRELLAGNATVAVYDGPVTTEGRIELLPFLREQSVSITAHRFGRPDPAMLGLQL